MFPEETPALLDRLRRWKPDRRFFVAGGIASLAVWGAFGYLLATASAPQSASPDGPAIVSTLATQIVTPTAASTGSSGSAITATPRPVTPTPVLAFIPEGGPATAVDYGPMTAKIESLISQADYDVGAAFVDTLTGQAISMGRGEGRFHAMSTFKGPLAVYYLWLVERGRIEEAPQDEFRIRQMLDWSSNVDTTCVFQSVGGIAGFNDWLAEMGLDRKGNWVYNWDSWPCYDFGGYFVPDNDARYRDGDQGLGLPGGRALMVCPDERIPCDKAMTPIDLALFYARLYRGEIVKPPSLIRWLGWMEKPLPITSMFDALPPEADATTHAYTKNGTHITEQDYPVNVYHEAGLLTTPYGTFALAVFMQGNPEYRGTDIHGEIGRAAYDAFVEAHKNDGR